MTEPGGRVPLAPAGAETAGRESADSARGAGGTARSRRARRPALTHAALVEHCLAKPGAWLDEPWDGDLVAKVGDKIFAFLGSPGPDGSAGGVGLKCGRDAEAAREWRDRYPGEVTVSAYIGRYGWNSFTIGGAVPDDEVLEAVDASYDDVVSRLPRSRRPGAADKPGAGGRSGTT